LRRELAVVLRLHDQIRFDGQGVVRQAMQGPEVREVGLGNELGELQRCAVARFVGSLSGERKVANPCRGNPCLQFAIDDVEQISCFSGA
jgi:hypothetical protein